MPGTVACKSPEKAEGRRVDHRTDIVFLCVIFYEMATGKGPYEGDTSMSVLTGPSTELWIGDLSRGEPAPLGDRYWTGIDRLVWFPDGSGLAVSSFGFGLSGHEIFE